MKLYQFNNYIYYTDYEEFRDRPRLCYIKGQNYSIAIDAGHSDNHVNQFYQLLKENNLPLPELTILTHWHWDHTFALHAINGKSLANKKTNFHLQDFINKQNPEFEKHLKTIDQKFYNEYPDGKQIIVQTAQQEFEGKLTIDLINTKLEVFECISPHTDDCTLIYLPKEKLLFVGDGVCGTFPTWQVDKQLGEQMIEVLQTIDFNYSIGGHWENLNKEELINMIREYY